MTLVSPRFPSRRLREVEAGRGSVREGARGRHVHLLQQALLDLGYAFPRSTGRTRYSPDGAYGGETAQKVREFQSRSGLRQTGVVDQGTMRALDTRLRGYQHRVKLHFRSIANANVPFQRSLADAVVVFGQYGIKMEMASGESLMLTPAQMTLFDRIDGECNWVINSGEYAQLHGMGTPAASNEILVFYVRRFASSNLLGCGGHATNRPAATVAARASRWDTAHEVGHVLLGSGFSPVHVSDRRNLMHPTASTFSTVPVLTNMQASQMRRSPCCTRI